MNQSLHLEINHFPVWTFESRILKNEWATTNIAVIFSYMRAKFDFHDKGGRLYFESFEVIAKATGVCVRTAKAAIKVLLANEHLTIDKKKTPNSYVNVYTVKDVYDTWGVKSQKAKSIAKVSSISHKVISEDDLPEWARENKQDIKPKATKHSIDYYVKSGSIDFDSEDEDDSPF